MFKYVTANFLLIATILMSPQAYGQQAAAVSQLRTASGTVTSVDAEGWVVNVNTDNGKMIFFIEAESGLYRFTHHMASVEIAKGDQVTIQYIYSSGKNSIIKLVDNSSSKN